MGNPMFVFVKKLMKMKATLKTWSNSKACIPHLLKEAKKKMNEIDLLLQRDSLNELLIEKKFNIQKQWESLKKVEERRAWQISRQKWVCDGERNTKFYHSAIKRREANNAISEIYDKEGILINGQERIEQEAVDFYTALYNKD